MKYFIGINDFTDEYFALLIFPEGNKDYYYFETYKEAKHFIDITKAAA